MFGAGVGPLWVLSTGKNILLLHGAVLGIVASLFLLSVTVFAFTAYKGLLVLILPFVIAALIAFYGYGNIAVAAGTMGIVIWVVTFIAREDTSKLGVQVTIIMFSTSVSLLLGTVLGGSEGALMAGLLGALWGIVIIVLQ